MSDPDEVRCAFPPPPFPVDRDGRIDLSGWCPGAGWFDLAGEPIPAPADAGPAFPQSGAALTVALDSRIARCRWHRLLVDAALPAHGAIRIEVATAEVELSPSVIAGLPDSAWSAVPLGAGGTGEALILAPPGRYAWLRITLSGDGDASPSVRAIEIEYPRISLRRYLPAAFGAEPASADFADRMLALFDAGLRDIEGRIDRQAAWFDPRSAPSGAGGGPDFLSWLAAWVGISFDRRWPEARRRALLRLAGRLFACRGTLHRPARLAAALARLGPARNPAARPGALRPAMHAGNAAAALAPARARALEASALALPRRRAASAMPPICGGRGCSAAPSSATPPGPARPGSTRSAIRCATRSTKARTR